MAAMFLDLNRNKRSVILDLNKPEGRDALLRLIKTADVLMHNLRPKPAAKLKIAYLDVAAINPRLIYCANVGYSRKGPYRDEPAYDDIIQARCGIAGLAAQQFDGPPRYAPTAMADKTTGLMALATISMALYERERSGKGQEIEIPMYETLVSFLLAEHPNGAAFDPPKGPIGYPRILSPYRKPFRTKDGYICALPYTDRQWAKFFEVAGHPELAKDPRFASLGKRTENISVMYKMIEEFMTERTTADWLDVLTKLDIPVSPVNGLDDLLKDKHMKEVGFFQYIDHPTEGRILKTGIPANLSRTPGAFRRPTPRFGEHSVEVLAEAGYSEAEIKALVAKGAAVDGR
jgi:crotonobetainyl-CoA:carnitine CoA-transferase CaiB-like acyl-CoA transferase